MTINQAIYIKSQHQYILQDASFPELIEADNLSIEALKRVKEHREPAHIITRHLLPGETKE